MTPERLFNSFIPPKTIIPPNEISGYAPGHIDDEMSFSMDHPHTTNYTTLFDTNGSYTYLYLMLNCLSYTYEIGQIGYMIDGMGQFAPYTGISR